MKHLRLVEENLGEVSSDLNFDALTEDSPDLIADLQDAYSKVKIIGDQITKLSESTNDVELKSTFIDLASSAYQLALDIEDAGQTVQDLKQEDLAPIGGEDDMEILEEIPPMEDEETIEEPAGEEEEIVEEIPEEGEEEIEITEQ